MFTQECFIRKRNSSLIQSLKNLGYKYPVQSKGNALSASNDGIISDLILLQEDVLNGTIDCDDNESLFLALAALRNDSDIDQWFVYKNKWFLCDVDNIEEEREYRKSYYQGAWYYLSHKATIQEIIEHFKK